MNAINLLQMVSMPKNMSKVAESKSNSENSKFAFLQILDQAMVGEKLDLTAEALPDGEAILDLHKLIKQLVEKLSFSDTQLDEDLLNSPIIKDFMEQLPLELQMQIADVFVNNNVLSDIIDETVISIEENGYLQDPAKLLALVITLSEAGSEISNPVAPKLENQLEKLLPLLFTEGKQVAASSDSNTTPKEIIAKEFQQLLQQLTNKLQSMSGKEKENLVNTFHGEKQTFKGEQVVLSAFMRNSSKQSSTTAQTINLPLGQGLQLNPVQQFVLHVGEQRSEQQTAEQFSRQFQNILGRSSLSQFPNGSNQLTIKLFPEHLGRLDVKLTQQNGVIIAQLMTTTQSAKKVIESQLHHLKQAFQAQNIQVEKIEINIQQQQQQSLNQSDKQNQDDRNRGQHQSSAAENDDSDKEFRFEDFLEDTFNTKV